MLRPPSTSRGPRSSQISKPSDFGEARLVSTPSHLGDPVSRASVGALGPLDGYKVAEYAYLTPRGEPLCWPVTPYVYPERSLVAIATGLAYPNKAEYAKVHPKVALYFSDREGRGEPDEPRVLVQSQATVLDQDLQANTDRYVTELRGRFGVARLALNPLTVRLLDFYLPRLWVEMGADEVSVDDTPVGRSPAVARHSGFAEMATRFPTGVLTTIDPNGFPSPRRTAVAPIGPEEAVVTGGYGGPACLTFHRHSLGGTRFHAHLVRGDLEVSQGQSIFRARRTVDFFGNGAMFPLSVVGHVGTLRSRLRRELERRGQPMPELRVPH